MNVFVRRQQSVRTIVWTSLLFASVITVFGLASTMAQAQPAAKFRVVVLAPGPKNDGAWSNSWWDGLQQAKSKLGVDVDFVPNLFTPEDHVSQGTAFASKGVNLIIVANGGMAQPARTVARQFPNTTVCVGLVQPTKKMLASDPKNLCYFEAANYEGTFQAGVLAALVSKTGVIGDVGGYVFPALTREVEGFHLGARCVNPKIKFQQQYINSWVDTGKAQAAAQTMIARNADVILSSTNQASVGLFSAAKQAKSQGKQVFVIPSYFDAHSRAPDVVLTSVVYNLDKIAVNLVSRAKAGRIKNHEFVSYTLGNIGVGHLAPLYQFKGQVGATNLAKLAAISRKIRSGQINLPRTTLEKVGGGANVNLKSIGC